MVGNVLLENAADVGVGIISSQGQWSSRMRMSQESGMREVRMLLKGGAGYENIIEIDKSKRKILENVVH